MVKTADTHTQKKTSCIF